jgi:hypothetical protein
MRCFFFHDTRVVFTKDGLIIGKTYDMKSIYPLSDKRKQFYSKLGLKISDLIPPVNGIDMTWFEYDGSLKPIPDSVYQNRYPESS